MNCDPELLKWLPTSFTSLQVFAFSRISISAYLFLSSERKAINKQKMSSKTI